MLKVEEPGYVASGVQRAMKATCCADFPWQKIGTVAAGLLGSAISPDIQKGWTEAIELQEMLLKFEQGEYDDIYVYQVSLRGAFVIPNSPVFNLACRVLFIAERSYVCAEATRTFLAREALSETELDDSIPENSVELGAIESVHFGLSRSLSNLGGKGRPEMDLKKWTEGLDLGVRYYGLWKACFVWDDRELIDKARRRAIYNCYFFSKVLVNEGPKWIERAIHFMQGEEKESGPVAKLSLNAVLGVLNYWGKAESSK